VVTLAAFMELLDTTIVNVSLPHIAGNLSASYDEVPIGVIATFAVMSLVEDPPWAKAKSNCCRACRRASW
jgi:hypothetical protein